VGTQWRADIIGDILGDGDGEAVAG
jgi:hypothetical protein